MKKLGRVAEATDMMYLNLIAGLLLTVQAQPPGSPQSSSPQAGSQQASSQQDGSQQARVSDKAEANSTVLNTKLLSITRIFVDDFGADAESKQIQAMVVNSISESKRFIITENKDKADAVLKGSALEKTSQEFHSLNDSAAAASAHASSSGHLDGSFANGTGTVTGSSRSYHSAGAVAADDSTASSMAVNDARVAVRLVAADGDVIWTTTQESRGAKYKGASADVADKVVKQLMRDLERLQAAANKPGVK